MERKPIAYPVDLVRLSTSLDGGMKLIKPKSVTPDMEPAVEYNIRLYELMYLLENLRAGKIPTTFIFHLYDPDFHGEFAPDLPKVVEAINALPNDLNREIHYYDILSVAYWDTNSTAIISPYLTAYPLPAFFQGVYDLDVELHHVSLREAAGCFLDGTKNSRVILLPRCRYKGGGIQGDFLAVVSYLTADHDESRVLLPAEDDWDLALLPNETFLANGIPVIELGEQKTPILYKRKLLKLEP